MELKEYLRIIGKRLWILILFVSVFAMVSAFISYFILDPVYQSNTTLYVGKNVSSEKAIAYNDLLVGNQLVKDYRELVKSRLISSMVIQELNLQNISPNGLAAKLSVNLKNDTRFIEIAARDPNGIMAQKIAESVAKAFKVKAVELIDVQNVQVIDKAEVPGGPVKPNKRLNILIAAFIGLMSGLGIIFLLEYFDNTIKTPEDVQKHLEIPVIGNILMFND